MKISFPQHQGEGLRSVQFLSAVVFCLYRWECERGVGTRPAAIPSLVSPSCRPGLAVAAAADLVEPEVRGGDAEVVEEPGVVGAAPQRPDGVVGTHRGGCGGGGGTGTPPCTSTPTALSTPSVLADKGCLRKGSGGCTQLKWELQKPYGGQRTNPSRKMGGGKVRIHVSWGLKQKPPRPTRTPPSLPSVHSPTHQPTNTTIARGGVY